MKDTVKEILNIYCQKQMAELKNDELYISLEKLTHFLGFSLICEIGKNLNNIKSNDIYLSISILNEKNKIIKIWDEGHLNASTKLLSVDRKERIKFFLWQDKDFIEDIRWMINELNNLNAKI